MNGALTLGNVTFVNNTASSSSNYCPSLGSSSSSSFGGAFYHVDGDLRVRNSTFINNTANSSFSCFFGSICIDMNINSSAYGGAFYHVDGDLIVDNSTFINNMVNSSNKYRYDNYGKYITYGYPLAYSYDGAICNNGTNSKINNNSFINNTANNGAVIYNSLHNNINLTNNEYSGILEGNTHIYNTTGIIISPVTVIVLENKTIDAKVGENITLFANITTEDGASVAGGLFKFIIDDAEYTATSNDDGNYTYKNYIAPSKDYLVVDVYYDNATDVTIKTSSLTIKLPSIVNVTVKDVIYGENVTICINVTSGATGNVTVSINNKTYNKTHNINLTNCGAVLNIAGLNAGEYYVNVTYNGDDDYSLASNNTTFNVIKANATMTLDINAMAGKNATINVIFPMILRQS